MHANRHHLHSLHSRIAASRQPGKLPGLTEDEWPQLGCVALRAPLLLSPALLLIIQGLRLLYAARWSLVTERNCFIAQSFL